MTASTDSKSNNEIAPQISLKEFFEKTPPGVVTSIKDLAAVRLIYNSREYCLNLTDLELHCDICGDSRLFKHSGNHRISDEKTLDEYIIYVCKNCERKIKKYSIWAIRDNLSASGRIYKYGEYPLFGPPSPTKLLKILGNEKEYFLKGKRCEGQGLGIAAFAYYRRVIDMKRVEIFDAIIKVAKTLDTKQQMIDDLENAKKEPKFSKGVETIKHGIPNVLLIDGHNPLTLLYSALSQGLHADTDSECLNIAASIRAVLSDLVEKMSQVTVENKELKEAVSILLKKTAKKIA